MHLTSTPPGAPPVEVVPKPNDISHDAPKGSESTVKKGGLFKRTLLGLTPGQFNLPKVNEPEPAAPATKPGPGAPAPEPVLVEAPATKPGPGPAAPAVARTAPLAAVTQSGPGPAPPAAAQPIPLAAVTQSGPGPAPPAVASPAIVDAPITQPGPGPVQPLTVAKPPSAPFQTMLGVAPDAPSAMAPVNEAKRTLLGAGAFSVPEASTPLPGGSKKETLIGVAIPGIAPINPGVDKSEQPPPAIEQLPMVVPDDEPDLAQFGIPAARSPRRYVAMSLGIAAAFLAVTCVLALWWWRSTPKLTVQVRTDESGRDFLELDCPNCSDGSGITLGADSTLFDNHHASIALKQPLKMGENAVQLMLARRGARAEPIQLRVPVDFRVAGDMSALGETPPKVRLLVDKTPSVTVEVDKQPLSFDGAGHGHYDIDVTNDVTGESNVGKVLERRIAYTAQTPSGPVQGAVLTRIGIVPLSVDAPGPLYMTDREEFKLCGTTGPSAQIDIAGLKIDVDASGHFCHSMIIKEVGKFTIWITARENGFAPRKVQRVIERYANLEVYARKLYKEVPHDLSANSAAATPLVALVGTIVELSERPPVTRLLLQFGPKSGPRGLVRVVASNQAPLKAGHSVTVFGQVTGTLKGPDGRDMSEVSAAFITPGTP